jgi:hypothetical protein
MKKILLIVSVFLAFQANAQEEDKTINPSDSIQKYNRWSFEVMTGTSDGNHPYGEGFNSI